MFHLTESEANRLREKFHARATEALDAENYDRAVIMQEAAQLVHEAQMEAFDKRAATARRRRQRQRQGAKR